MKAWPERLPDLVTVKWIPFNPSRMPQSVSQRIYVGKYSYCSIYTVKVFLLRWTVWTADIKFSGTDLLVEELWERRSIYWGRMSQCWTVVFTVRQKQKATLTWEEVQEVLGWAWPRKTFHLHDVHLLLLLFRIIPIGRQWWVIMFTRASCLGDRMYNQLFWQQTCSSSHKDGCANVKLTNKKVQEKVAF